MRLARSISSLWYTLLGRLFNEYYKVGWRIFSWHFPPLNRALSLRHCVKEMHYPATSRV